MRGFVGQPKDVQMPNLEGLIIFFCQEEFRKKGVWQIEPETTQLSHPEWSNVNECKHLKIKLKLF